MAGGMTVTTRVRRTKPAALKKVITTVQRNADKAAEDFAKNTTTGAKRRAHVITGHMRDSITHYPIRPGKHIVRVNAYYGVYEERGTRHRPPHPFFQPAAIAAKVRFQNDIRKVFK